MVHLNLYSRFAQVHNKIKIKIDKQDLYFRYKPSYTEGVQTSETDFTIYGWKSNASITQKAFYYY